MTNKTILTYISISVLFLLSFVSNAAMTDHFVTTWKTDNPGFTNDTSIYIKTSGGETYLYDVDWDNDGAFDEFGITGDISHDFGMPGIKTIRITGNFPRIYFPDNGDNKKIIAIEQWGTFPWTSMNRAFEKANNLMNNAPDVPNLSICSDLSHMFSGASSVGSEMETGNWNWDTSHVTDMSFMFYDNDTNVFNQNIGNWNTFNVTNMRFMFKGAAKFNQDIEDWNTSQVTEMGFMFYKALSFNQNISQWNIEKVIRLDRMFKFARLSVENYDALLIGWSTQNLIQGRILNSGNSIYCSQAAKDAHNILTSTFGWTVSDLGQCQPNLTITSRDRIFINENQIDVSQILITEADSDTVNFSITGGVDQSFFDIEANTGLLSLKSPLDYETPLDSDNDNYYLVEITVTDDGTPQESISQSLTIIVKNAYENLANDDFVTTWQTNNQGISNDTSITIQTNKLNPNLEYYFNVDWDNDGVFDEFNITNDITHDYGTSGEKIIRISGQYPLIHFESNNSDAEKIISINQWGTNQWAGMYGAFRNAKNIVNNAQDIPNLSAAISLNHMFFNATSIGNESEVANWEWDISNILNLEGVFGNASSFNQDISHWDTTGVERMTHLFSNATSFNQNINNWNTYNVSHMKGMFLNATVFNQNISNWNTRNVNRLEKMFKDASSFDQNIGNWNTNRVVDMHNMFDNAFSFNQDLSRWDVENVTRFDNMFRNIWLSIENYDALLIGWNSLNLSTNESFDGGLSIYCSHAAQAAHNNMTSVLNWSITDGGACEPQLTIISNDSPFIEENHTTVIKVLTTDPDFDNVSFAITGGVDQTSFSINQNSGLLSFNNPPDFENPTDTTGNNYYQVEVTATDDGTPQEFATQMLSVKVTDLEETSPIDLNLQITTNTDTVNIGEILVFDITITNQGIEDALNAIIFDILPSAIIDSTWVCNSTGTATCGFSGSGEIMEIVTIPNDSSSITYTVTATLGNESFMPLTYQAFAEAIEPHYDTDLSNNMAVITLTFDLIFSGGFD